MQWRGLKREVTPLLTWIFSSSVSVQGADDKEDDNQ